MNDSLDPGFALERANKIKYINKSIQINPNQSKLPQIDVMWTPTIALENL